MLFIGSVCVCVCVCVSVCLSVTLHLTSRVFVRLTNDTKSPTQVLDITFQQHLFLLKCGTQVFDVDMVDHSFHILKRRDISTQNPSYFILPVVHARDESSVGI